jgi:G:T-mismatch repair DNA endonuclease (very short patch repair protein)
MAIMSMREREVESHLTKLCEAAGLPIYKFVPDQAPGMPDRMILLPGQRVVWVELKKPVGGRVAKLQQYRHKVLREAGHRVVVVWSKEQAEELVAELSGKKREDLRESGTENVTG